MSNARSIWNINELRCRIMIRSPCQSIITKVHRHFVHLHRLCSLIPLLPLHGLFQQIKITEYYLFLLFLIECFSLPIACDTSTAYTTEYSSDCQTKSSNIPLSFITYSRDDISDFCVQFKIEMQRKISFLD